MARWDDVIKNESLFIFYAYLTNNCIRIDVQNGFDVVDWHCNDLDGGDLF